MKLWIDDYRPLPSFYDTLATTVDSAIRELRQASERGERVEVISFDYDAHKTLDWTFTPVAEWIRDTHNWPVTVRIHTYNWWFGRPWYEDFFDKWAPDDVYVDLHNPWDYMATDPNLRMMTDQGTPDWVLKFMEEVNK